MNTINFTGRNNFPLSVETMTFLQEMIGTVGTLALLGGDTYILSGCETTDLNVSSGYVVIDGEILKFTGGALQEYVYIKESKRTVTAQGYTFSDVYNTRTVEFGYGDTKYKWEDFKRVSSNIELSKAIANISTTIEGFQGIPKGVTVPWYGDPDNPPAGWAISAGQSPDIPNMFGRTAVGYNPEDPDYDKVGKVGGAKESILNAKNIPDHYHYYTSTNHNWDADNVASKLGIKAVQNLARGADGNDSRTFLFQTSPAGEENPEPIDRRMPYMTLVWITKL